MIVQIDGVDAWIGEIDDWARERTGAHRTTIARWRRRGWPRVLIRLAALELDGQLGLIHPAWRGWFIRRSTGELCAPEEWAQRPWTPLHLLALSTVQYMATAPTREPRLYQRS